jgi:hypothetical protein
LIGSQYRKAHSTGWIDPEGNLQFLDSELTHDDLSAYFPGVPADEEYPSDFAVRKLGYLRVSNPFEFSFQDPLRRGDPRLETMAQFITNAILSYEKRGPPSWLEVPFRSAGTPLDWEVRITRPSVTRSNESMTVADFVDRFGSRESSDRLFGHFLGKLTERLLRSMVKRLLQERNTRARAK